MYVNVSSKLTRLLIKELRQFFSYYPDLRSPQPEFDLPQNIQSKYSVKERASRYIVVRASGSSQHVSLSPDDFRNFDHSYAGLRHYDGTPNLSIEWIGENALEIQNNNGVFPSPPGFYFIDICDYCQSEDESKQKSFWKFKVTPVYEILDENVFKITDTEYQLGNGSYIDKTLNLYRMPGNILLHKDVNYFSDPESGKITLVLPLDSSEFLSADYRVQGETLNPNGFKAFRNRATLGAIPGLFLAFGQRISKGDRHIVEVSAQRELQAYEFGGRWETSIDLDFVDKDIDTQREMLEHALIFLRSQLRTRWSSSGIEIMQVNAGGESEELYDQNDFFYRGSISLSIETEWTVWVPIPGRINRLEVQNTPDQILAGMSDLEITELQEGIRVGTNFIDFQDPFYDGKTGSVVPWKRNPTFPMIR